MADILQSLEADDDGTKTTYNVKRKPPALGEDEDEEEEENQDIPKNIPANPLAPPAKRQKQLVKRKGKAGKGTARTSKVCQILLTDTHFGSAPSIEGRRSC